MLELRSTTTTSTSLRLRIWLIVVGVGANGLVLALGAYSLWQSRQLYEQHAITQTQNICIGLDQAVSKSIEKIDLALDFVVVELERQAALSRMPVASTEKFLDDTTKRVLEVEAIRVSNAGGSIVFGAKTSAQTVDINDRDYFQHFKQGSGGALFVSEPLLGRISRHFIIVFAKRFNHPDGSFAGVVYATVPLSHFTRQLGQFDIGPHGTIALRDDKLRLITRLPAVPNEEIGSFGNTHVSPEFHALHNEHRQTTTYHTARALDGLERTVSVRALKSAPAYALVGLASQDYLADWWTEVYEICGFQALFVAMTTLALLAISRLLKAADLREATIADLAFKDPLTGLPTIRLTEDRLEMAMYQAIRDDNKMGVMFLDLDGFKPVNDAHGHAAGDWLLKEVARRIQDAIRANDTVSRIGGDEFLIVLGAISGRATAAEIAAKILAIVATPVAFKNTVLTVHCSIGISLFPDDAQDMQSLRRLADEAMYTVKNSGKNNFAFHGGKSSRTSGNAMQTP